jgi:methionyl-tRNA formyltransferase
MKLIFAGTPDFAVPALDALLKAGHEIALVITRADRPQGRGLAVQPPPVKARALKYGLEVIQPAKISQPDIVQRIKEVNADAAVVAAFAALIPKSLLDVPKHGWLNIHPSLLPKYRGPSPVKCALYNGDRTTGVTIIRLEEAMDSGPIILMEETQIGEEENAAQLADHLAKIGASLIVKALALIESGTAEFRPQDHSAATYCRKFTKSDGLVDWSVSNVADHVHAMTPWPGAQTVLRIQKAGKTIGLLVTGARHLGESSKTQPGQIVKIAKAGISVATGGNDVLITTVKPAGKKEMPAYDFANGYRLSTGDLFIRQEK